MTRIYFTHKLTGSRNETDVYTFDHILKPTYGWYLREGVFTANSLISVDSEKKKKFGFNEQGVLTEGIGSITDEGLGFLDVDDTKMTACGKTIDQLKSNMSDNRVVKVTVLSNLDVADWIRYFTNLTEVEPNKFELYPEQEDTMNPGQTIPAQYLDLN